MKRIAILTLALLALVAVVPMAGADLVNLKAACASGPECSFVNGLNSVEVIYNSLPADIKAACSVKAISVVPFASSTGFLYNMWVDCPAGPQLDAFFEARCQATFGSSVTSAGNGGGCKNVEGQAVPAAQ